MASRDKPPFRADHVGSLLRPPELARARADFKAGRIDAPCSHHTASRHQASATR